MSPETQAILTQFAGALAAFLVALVPLLRMINSKINSKVIEHTTTVIEGVNKRLGDMESLVDRPSQPKKGGTPNAS